MSTWNDSANRIFLEALEIPDQEDRAKYVIQACGNDIATLTDVERLLRASDSMGEFLESPLSRLPDDLEEDIRLSPHMVGPYRILEEIGEGGMGIVYRALQETPVRRQVALKLIKPGLDTRQVIRRFEAERQVLALMDHPNIARIIDAGATELGRPYFVMELVPGIPITRYSRETRLSLQARLELFLDVCRGVQHAHQKGIIHRDLKPSNILVNEVDGRPVVKIIDFGVAKAVDQKLLEHSLHTRFMQLVGTPTYMSPEQASLSGVDVDTRSDVYSLGVLLYELVTETTPFDSVRLSSVTEDECRRIICQEEPSLPSTRLTGAASQKGEQIAGTLAVDPRGLKRRLKRELDWIVMQAIEKDRSRRYQSASELADDLRRFIHDEPVAACPQSSWYTARKLIRKHRAAMTTAALVVWAVVTGAAFAIWQSLEATEARRIADRERDRAQEQSERTRRLLYAGDMRLATLAWQRNDARNLADLLGRHVPKPEETDLRGFVWHFLSQHHTAEARELFTTNKPLYHVSLSHDGRQVATAGAAGDIHLVDLKTRGVRTIASGQIEVNGLAFAKDGKSLFSAGDNGEVVEWTLPAVRRKRSFKTSFKPAFNVFLDSGSQLLATCGKGPNIELFDRRTGKNVDPLVKHVDPIECLSMSDDGLLAAGSNDYSVTMWNLQTKELLWHHSDHPLSGVKAVALSPKGGLVAIGHDSGLLTIRHARSGAMVSQMQLTDAVQSLAYSPADAEGYSMWLAVGERGGTIRLLPNDADRPGSLVVATMTTLDRGRMWQAHADRVFSLAFDAEGRTLLSAGGDGALKSWDILHSMPWRALPHRIDGFVVLDDSQVVAAGENVWCYTADLEKPQLLFDSPETNRRIRYSRGTRRLYSESYFTRTYEFPPATKTGATRTLDFDEEKVGCFDASPVREEVAFSVTDHSSQKAVLIWRPTGETRIPVQNACFAVKYAPNGDLLFDQEREIWILKPGETSPYRRLRGHQGAIWHLGVSADGRYLASASKDRTARVWDLANGQLLWSELAHLVSTDVAEFAPDGETLVTTGDDGVLRMWRWRERTLIFEYPLPVWPVNDLAFSPDGRRLYLQANQRLHLLDATGGTAGSP
jgi:eukaryotic-like serine/threonine-protein kinase